jgi:hypothetical protein
MRGRRSEKKKTVRWEGYNLLTLMRLLDEGHDYETIARRLGVSRTALAKQVTQRGLGRQSNPNLFSASDLERKFFKGITIERVAQWVAWGWLKAVTRRENNRTEYTITRDNLMAFLEDERSWLVWEPKNIRDKDIRQWATEMRASAGWRWLTLKETGERLNYTVAALGEWCRRGWFETATLYNNAWRIRSDEADRIIAESPDRFPSGHPRRRRRVRCIEAEYRDVAQLAAWDQAERRRAAHAHSNEQRY